MRRWFGLAPFQSFAAVLLAVAVGACSAPSAAPATSSPTAAPVGSPSAPATPAPFTVVDDAGRSVTFTSAPLRIVSAAPSTTELAFAVGLGDRIVAVDKFSNYPPEAASRPSIGSYTKPDLEVIVGANPDLVLAIDVHVAELVPALESRGIAVLVLAARNIEGVLLNLQLLGRVAGDASTADALAASLRTRIAAVDAAVLGRTPVRLFYELDPTLFTAGPGTFIDDLIRRAGGANIAAGAAVGFPQLSPEDVIAADPEVIILADEAAGATADSVAVRPGWARISAVATRRIVNIDPDIGSRPGPRVVDALEAIASALAAAP